MGNAILVHQRQPAFRVEFLHDNQGAAEFLRCHAIAQGSGMIERRRGQIDHVRIEAIEHPDHAGERINLVYRAFGQRPDYALGPTGCAA